VTKRKKADDVPVVAIVGVRREDSETGCQELYVVCDGVRIAKRGYPGTPQAGTWVSLEPGYRVFGGGDQLVVEHKRVRIN
jgi:hypothetical protein